MTTAVWNITIDKGITFERTLIWQDVSSGSPVPINLTGYSAMMQIRPYAGAPDADILITLSTMSGITLGGALGTIKITIPATNTAAFPSDYKGEFDLVLVSPSYKVDKIVRGDVTISPSCTVGAGIGTGPGGPGDGGGSGN
jgi:hypothetical protein